MSEERKERGLIGRMKKKNGERKGEREVRQWKRKVDISLYWLLFVNVLLRVHCLKSGYLVPHKILIESILSFRLLIY